MVKEFFNVFLGHSKREELKQETNNFVRDVCELLTGKTIDEYFKVGGKGKASLLELYSYLVKFFANSGGQCDINWKKFTKVVCQNFLDKDPVVQSTLWKHCNK